MYLRLIMRCAEWAQNFIFIAFGIIENSGTSTTADET